MGAGQRQLVVWARRDSLEGGAGWYRDGCRTRELKSVFRKPACTVGPGVPPLTALNPPLAPCSPPPWDLWNPDHSQPCIVPCLNDPSKCSNPTPGPTCSLRIPGCRGYSTEVMGAVSMVSLQSPSPLLLPLTVLREASLHRALEGKVWAGSHSQRTPG